MLSRNPLCVAKSPWALWRLWRHSDASQKQQPAVPFRCLFLLFEPYASGHGGETRGCSTMEHSHSANTRYRQSVCILPRLRWSRDLKTQTVGRLLTQLTAIDDLSLSEQWWGSRVDTLLCGLVLQIESTCLKHESLHGYKIGYVYFRSQIAITSLLLEQMQPV